MVIRMKIHCLNRKSVQLNNTQSTAQPTTTTTASIQMITDTVVTSLITTCFIIKIEFVNDYCYNELIQRYHELYNGLLYLFISFKIFNIYIEVLPLKNSNFEIF